MENLDTGVKMLDLIYKWGALPILCLLVWVLWKKVNAHETKIEKLNEDQKNDIRTHAEDVKGIQQNTLNTLNRFSNSLENQKK